MYTLDAMEKSSQRQVLSSQIWPLKPMNLVGRLSTGYTVGPVFIVGGPFSSCQSQLRANSTVNIFRRTFANSLPTQLLKPPPKGMKLNLEESSGDGDMKRSGLNSSLLV